MQTKFKTPAMAVSMLLACSACTQEDEGPPTQTQPPAQTRPPSLEESGAIPRLERSPEVVGIDADSDGIRDDVEAYIADTYETEAQRNAARQFARVMQDAMLSDKTDTAAVKAIAIRGSRAVNCVYARFDGAAGSRPAMQVVEELRAVSTNTKPRLLAYLAYSKVLDGTAGALPEGDTCE